jgi:hypothetical protein
MEKCNLSTIIINKQYPVKYIDIDDAFHYFLQHKLVPTTNKRRWISIRKISTEFTKWYISTHKKNTNITSLYSYKKIIKVLYDMNINVTNIRITGYYLK